MVSRLLTDARENGIVEIRVQRPLQSDPELENSLKEQFGLADAFVALTSHRSGDRLLRKLGTAGARMLGRYISPHITLGLAWGTSISATVDAFEAAQQIPVKVVQLVGAMGARITEYDGHYLVRRMAEKLGGEAYYLNAPYLCQNAQVAKALLETKGVKETIGIAKKTDVALLGIGTTVPEHSSFFLAGYVPWALFVGFGCQGVFDVLARAAQRAREAILAHGGAATSNVFTRAMLALFGILRWEAVPEMPVEIVLLPRWFPFHLSKVSYWARTVMVPLLVLQALRPRAKNPKRREKVRTLHLGFVEKNDRPRTSS